MTKDESYILYNLKLMDRGEASFDQTAEKFCNYLAINKNITVSPEVREEIIGMLNAYRNAEMNDHGFYNGFNIITKNGGIKIEEQKEVVKEVPKTPVTPPTSPSELTVEVDTEIIYEASSKLASVESDVESANITIPSAIGGYAVGLEKIVNESKAKIEQELNSAKAAMQEIIELVAEIDDTVVLPGTNKVGFTDLAKLAYDFNKNREPVLVDEQFFINAGYKVEGNCAIMTIDGKECMYDIKNQKFIVDGKEHFYASIYIPKEVTDTSKLNVFTCFIEGGDAQKKAITRQTTNSVILKIQKYGSSNKFDDEYDETGLATKFVNKAAKTDLTKCRNVIGGDSVYGTHSLRIAGANKGLYQTVYCVNNAAIVMGENGAKGAKTKFTDLEELKNLDGLDIYFISATDDPNTYYGSEGDDGWVNKKDKFEEAYVYKGLKLICENCPNANIHMVYDEIKASAKKEKLITLLKSLESEYGNYSYDSEYWSMFAKRAYTTHGEGKNIVSDLVYSSVTNYNEYQK